MMNLGKPPWLAIKYCLGKWYVRHSCRILLAQALLACVFIYPSQGQSQLASLTNPCFAPEEPFVPSDDAEFKRFADLIAQDFERYFVELTEYSNCMDATRHAVMERAKEVSKEYRSFWDRAKVLGVSEHAAIKQQ